MSELNVGVVGLGLGRHHVAACAGSEAVARLAVCDPDPARRAEVRAGCAEVDADYPDIREMLDAERLDAVSIVTPDHFHRPHAEAALAAGCHVLLTKPIATALDDARAIVRAADAAGRKLMVAHERRFRAEFVRIKEMLAAGDLGEVIHLRIDAVQDKRAQFARSPWYASDRAGRSAMVGTGIHEVDLIRWLADAPIRSVCGFGNRLGGLVFPADKTTAAIFQFAGGAVGQVTVTYEAHWPPAGGIDDAVRIVCTKGLVVGGRCALDGRDGWLDLPADDNPMVAGTFGCVESFLRAIVEDAPVPIDGREAFASLAAAVAADTSAATGRPVPPAPF